MNRRRMPLVLAFAAVLVLGSLGWLVSLSKTSQAAPVPSSDAAFKGKVLLVHSSNMRPAFLLEKAQVQRIGDRSCLVGKGTADDDVFSWWRGRTVWIPMEHIGSITEFDDVKQATEAVKRLGGGVPFGIHEIPADPFPAPAVPAPAPAVDRPAKR
jgi:hypothetical protein